MARKYEWDFVKTKKVVNPIVRAKKRIEKAKKKEEAMRPFAEKLKREATEAEKILYEALIECKIDFEFQKILSTHKFTYIADFIIQLKSGRKILVECDGFHHFGNKQKGLDQRRDSRIMSVWGYRTLRFKNSDVIRKTRDVLFKIMCFEPVTLAP